MMSRSTTPPQTASMSLHCPSPLPAFRNLGSELAGVIFTCTEDSFNDCLHAGVFGLPRTHFQYVQHVRPSMVLFLFNFSTRELHGIFRAITGGKIDNEPGGVNPEWAAKFPAQVREAVDDGATDAWRQVYVDTSDTYLPLPESAFRRVIAENYVSSNSAQFSFELDMEQVARLSEAFKQYAVNGTTPIPISQNVLGNFPAPSPSNAGPMMDRPSQAWLSEKTRRLSPVGRRPGLEFLNYGRPKSSMDYLGHPQHFETEFNFPSGQGNVLQHQRLSVDVNSLNSSHINVLNSLLGGGNPTGPLLGGADALAPPQVGHPSRLLGSEAGSFPGLVPHLSDPSAAQLFNPSQLGLAAENAVLTHRMSAGRLSAGHLSPDPDPWTADATAQAFKLAASRLTPDVSLSSQTGGGNLGHDDRRRGNIWQVNSKDMGLLDAQKLLSGMPAFPELKEVLQENAGLNGHSMAEMPSAFQDPTRAGQLGEGLDAVGNVHTAPTWKPPRPHSSTDGEVQSLTQNLQNFWSDAKLQMPESDALADLYPHKSTSRASAGKGRKSKDPNLDECEELSDSSPIGSEPAVQDQVNIVALEAESRQYQFSQTNGEGLYPLEGSAEKTPVQAVAADYDIGLPRNGKQHAAADSLTAEPSLILPSAPAMALDFGIEVAGGQEVAAFDEVSKLTLENEQLKLERSQLQKQLNSAMKKKPIDYTSITASSTDSAGAGYVCAGGCGVGTAMEICVLGGTKNASSIKIVSSDRLEETKEVGLSVGFSRGAAVALGQHLFYLGGVDPSRGNQAVATAYHIDYKRDGKEILKPVASMGSPRSLLGAVSVGMKIFAIGGSKDSGPTETVEIYDPFRDTWQMGPSLNSGRHSFGATAVNNIIYSVGGHAEKGTIQSVEMLDPREGRWIQLGSLSWSRAGLACCPVEHHLFAVGGNNGKAVLNTAEILDLRKGIVMESLTMIEPRHYGTATPVGECILILGGVQTMDTDTAPEFSRPEFYNTLSSMTSIGSESLPLVFHSTCSVSCSLY